MSVNETTPLLEVRDVVKQFPGVRALDGVSAHLLAGEVLAVVGENGAGKSTLMKILAGVYSLDAGQMLLEGSPVRFSNVADALKAGISLIHQELNLAENLDVAANLFLGREHTFGRLGWLQRRSMAAEAVTLLKRVGLPAELVHVTVDYLSPGQKQLVEIARVLSLKVRVLIMDEPTSSLTQTETDRLYEVIDDLRRSGVAIVYISHRLAEVKRVADRVVVLRDGRVAGELAKEKVTHDNLVRLMVGRELKQLYPRTRVTSGEVRFALKQEVGVSFSITAGEIVGMAGLVGAGRTELAEAVFGIRPFVGEIRLDGQPLSITKPREAIDQGILLVPEDRRLHGLILEESVGFNLSLPNLEDLKTRGLVSRSRERTLASGAVNRLRVKTPNLRQTVGLLSGGNQQKVVFGKWLAREPRVLILDEPTRGVDVGAREEIYAMIDQLASTGVAIWIISSDLEEILGMSDRIVVLHEGKKAGELTRDQFSEEAVMRLATGAGVGQGH